ncbi:uncharacterized protein [Diabrotica undecimpunctata]|uniref:uncharacterized protein n=1 Tax=Diabrotica undecimpunctata TaxID=50387 RepID=UPI003B63358B
MACGPNTKSARFLQTNLGRARLAHDLALEAATRRNIDVLIVSEPNLRVVREKGWHADEAGDVAVYIRNRKLRIYAIDAHDGYVTIRMERMNVICCYISPNIAMDAYEARLDEIMNEGRRLGEEFLVLGDFNAKSSEWGSPVTDARGRMLTDWVSALDLVVLNTGLEPTFVRGNSESYINVTCSSTRLATRVREWMVLPDYAGTHHRYIYFEVGGAGSGFPVYTGGNVQMNWDAFEQLVEWGVERDRGSDTYKVEDLDRVVNEAMKGSRPLGTSTGHTRPAPYWWTEEIKSERDRCLRLRRQIQRMRRGRRGEDLIRNLEELHIDCRRQLTRMIRREKRRSWMDLCERIDGDIFGQGYKIAMRHFPMRMNDRGLVLATEKTQAIILKGPRKREGVWFEYEGVRIVPSRCVKYLGITLHENGGFDEHLRSVTRRAAERAAVLGRIMPNIGGPSSERRRVLAGVVQSIVLYAAPVWYKAAEVSCYRNLLMRTDRVCLIRTACAYRTAPTAALYVITAVVPTHLLAGERHRLYVRGNVDDRVRSEERATTIEKWQREWEGVEDVAQWTKSLIPNIQRWVECGHRRGGYFLTQVLTGHGCFRTYLKRFGKAADDRCLYCREVDTVTHTLFHCPRWVAERTRMNAGFGRMILGVNEMVDEMMTSVTGWRTGDGFVRAVLAAKEREERVLVA